MTRKTPLLTDDQKARRRAAAKAEAKNKKVQAEIPLFADLVEKAKPNDEYWAWRFGKAQEGGGGGEEAAYLAGVDWRVDIWLMRKLAKQVMPPEDFALADAKRNDHGSQTSYWKYILTGRMRLVLKYWRHVFGVKTCKPMYYGPPESVASCDHTPFMVEKRVEIGELVVWPKEGWTPPFKSFEEVEAALALPRALEFSGAVELPVYGPLAVECT